MKPLKILALLATLSLLNACDSTLFGDPEPDLDNPFTQGSSSEIQDPAVSQPLSVIASQRYPGSLYALADDSSATIYALDDSGAAQGRIQLSGVTRNSWRDLAVHNGNILLLGSTATTRNVIQRFSEPDNPPPFDTQLNLISSLSVFVDVLGLRSCQSLATAANSNQATLLCGNEFYSFTLDEAGGTTNAEAAGTLPDLPANVVDFSVSPAGQFAVLTLSDQLRVAQSSSANWASAFSGGGRQVTFDHDEFLPRSSSFAFNGVLLHSLGTRTEKSLVFTIFNP